MINAQSVCNKADLLVDHFIQHNFDIICLTETWLSVSDKHRKVIGDLTLAGFTFYHVPRPNRLGGGIAILYRESIKRGATSSFTASSFESLCCDFQFPGTSTPIKILVLYRPPYSRKNKISTAAFIDEFADCTATLLTSQCKLLIVGDFNIHWDNSSNSETQKFRDILNSFGLTQMVQDGTHTNGHILDYVITRSCDSLVKSVEVSSLLSDHAALHCVLNISKPAPSRRTISYRKLKSINHDDFHADLITSDLIINPETELDQLIEQYERTLSEIIEKHAPLKKCVITIRPFKGWYTKEIAEAKKIRRRL